jgi:cob(I)alamin adenosyltransferase
MIHIYCGDGKGKTTAALGLALRAAGSGMRVHFVQFLKGGETSELASLARIPEITVLRCSRNFGFTFNMTAADKAAVTECHNEMLRTIRERLPETDLLVLDEFFAAYNHRLMDCTFAGQLIADCQAELVLTGRDPAEQFLELADYVSEIRAVKHPYTRGISARKGIEF